MNSGVLIRDVMLSAELREHPPVLVDVGAAGAFHGAWRAIAPYSVCIGFDPDDRDSPAEGAQARFRECHVVRAIVSDVESPSQQVYLTKSPHCSSVLRPNDPELSKYAHASLFEITGTAAVPAVRLDAVLDGLGFGRVDWLKTDSQGLDGRVFRSLTDYQQRTLMVADLEPGVMPGYIGEDRLEDVMRTFDKAPFWCASLVAKGAVRGSYDVLRRYLGERRVSRLAATERTNAGWVEIQYINTFEFSEMHSVRNLLFGWVIATLLGHHAFALELADRGVQHHAGDGRFLHLAAQSVKGILLRWRFGIVRRGLSRLGRLVRGVS